MTTLGASPVAVVGLGRVGPAMSPPCSLAAAGGTEQLLGSAVQSRVRAVAGSTSQSPVLEALRALCGQEHRSSPAPTSCGVVSMDHGDGVSVGYIADLRNLRQPRDPCQRRQTRSRNGRTASAA